MKKSNGMVFVNTTIQKQFTNGPKVSAEFQIIVAQDKNDEWIFDCVEPTEIDEIEMMGVKITDLENKRKAIAHFKSMGINLWDEMCKDMNEVIAMSGGAVVFVKEQTEIILPTKKTVTKPNDVVELTKFETDYVKIMADLKQKFGRLGYYNDKRKNSRRIKIQSSQSKYIKKYMKTKYPHIETYYNNKGEWELCFVLPI
jgi:translation initiation factor 1 (eIF-1/SUI1)